MGSQPLQQCCGALEDDVPVRWCYQCYQFESSSDARLIWIIRHTFITKPYQHVWSTQKPKYRRLKSKYPNPLQSVVIALDLPPTNDANIHTNPRNDANIDRSCSTRPAINSDALRNTFHHDGLVMTVERVWSKLKQRNERLSWKGGRGNLLRQFQVQAVTLKHVLRCLMGSRICLCWHLLSMC